MIWAERAEACPSALRGSWQLADRSLCGLGLGKRAQFHDPVGEFAEQEDAHSIQEDSSSARGGLPALRSRVGNDRTRESLYGPQCHTLSLILHVSKPAKIGSRAVRRTPRSQRALRPQLDVSEDAGQATVWSPG